MMIKTLNVTATLFTAVLLIGSTSCWSMAKEQDETGPVKITLQKIREDFFNNLGETAVKNYAVEVVQTQYTQYSIPVVLLQENDKYLFFQKDHKEWCKNGCKNFPFHVAIPLSFFKQTGNIPFADLAAAHEKEYQKLMEYRESEEEKLGGLECLPQAFFDKYGTDTLYIKSKKFFEIKPSKIENNIDPNLRFFETRCYNALEKTTHKINLAEQVKAENAFRFVYYKALTNLPEDVKLPMELVRHIISETFY